MTTIEDAIVSVMEAQMYNEDSARKAKRAIRRKQKFHHVCKKYESKQMKRNKKFGRKAMRDFDSHPKYGQFYQFTEKGITYITWNETDDSRAWRERKQFRPIELDTIDA